MSRQLVGKSIFAVALTAMLVIVTGCKIPITVTSNPPGARAYVGPLSGSFLIMDSNEESSREQYVGETPVTVQSGFAWNEWGHAWAHVEWPDGTKSAVKVRHPHEVPPSTPATFDFNEADYVPTSAKPNLAPATPSPAPVAAPAPAPSVSAPASPVSAPVQAPTSSPPARTTPKPAVPASAMTASDLIGTWQNDDDTNEWLVIHPNFSGTWHIGSIEDGGNINLASDNHIQFDYHDRAFNKNNSLNWKIVDSQTISINRYGQDVIFHHQ